MNFIKKLDNEEKIIIGFSTLLLGIIGFLFWRKNQNEKIENLKIIEQEPPKDDSIKIPTKATNPFVKTPLKTVIVDVNLTLNKGSKGTEVKALQNKLKIKSDGIFGDITEKSLFQKKGVRSITLAKFDIIKNKVTKPIIATPKKGTKLMAIKNDFNLFIAKKLPNGGFENTGEKATFLSFNYGDEVGTFEFARVHKPNEWQIKRNGKLYFVNAENVKTY